VYSWTTNNVTAMADTNGNSGASVNNPAYWYNWSQTLTDDSNISATITGGAYSSSNSTQWTSQHLDELPHRAKLFCDRRNGRFCDISGWELLSVFLSTQRST
jgi:hypothetical protein